MPVFFCFLGFERPTRKMPHIRKPVSGVFSVDSDGKPMAASGGRSFSQFKAGVPARCLSGRS
jgi:hypothetical protein